MSVTNSYRTFVLEQLNRAVAPVRARAMFGGVGLYAGDVFFALIADDILYFRTDDTTRGEFESLGMAPFRPFEEHGPVMSYYQLPEEILEDADTLRRWADRAIAAARAKRRGPAKPPRKAKDPVRLRQASPASTLAEAERALHELADPKAAAFALRFFKTGPGEYGEGDRFLGIRVPPLRALARRFRELPHEQVLTLLRSQWHEQRLLALLLLVEQYRRGTDAERDTIYRAYLAHTQYINNWDLVDSSAEHIVGPHIGSRRLIVLEQLARSASLWERRIAIVATFHWIKEGEFRPTLRLAKLLLDDPHDLIHKAVGWMLREVGKRDLAAEEKFLHEHYRRMPRTMLRYAIERLPERRRRQYLQGAL